MSSVCTRALVLSLAFIFVSGCSSQYVSKKRYRADLKAAQDFAEALERRNQELEAENRGLRKFARDATVVSTENKFYDHIANLIEAQLKSLDVGGSVRFDAKTGKWIIENSVLFTSGSYTISKKGRTILKTIADIYKKSDIALRIVGHTDRDPVSKASTKKALPVTHKLNLELSVLRAVAVAFQLNKSGVPVRRMSVEGQGNNNPIAANDKNPANKKKNRRVEIFILKPQTGK